LFESAYGQAYVFSAFIKDVDKRPDPTVWGSRLPFNTLCAEFRSPSGGWVHSVAFSPNGDALAFVSHDSSVSIAYPQGPEAPPTPLITVRTPLLPFVSLVWINENEIVAAGHDCQPVTFQGSEQGWYPTHCLIPIALFPILPQENVV
jgi:actin related protein 2/3 complex subunit 1A/1B